MIIKFALFERKGNYTLFHITDNLSSIIEDGYIKGGLDRYDMPIRKNIIHNWERGKFPTISATRNLNYMGGDTFELDVEKITDKFKIIPYSENPDFYLGFGGEELGGRATGLGKMKSTKNKHLSTSFQNMIRSKSKKAGNLYWKTKTNTNSMDFGIAEELILTDKLNIGKYVKRIFLDDNVEKMAQKIKDKYPHIEIYRKKNNYLTSLKFPIEIEKEVSVL